MKEIYKDLVGFEGYYEVSNLGNVKRKKNKTIYKDGRIAYFSETVLKKATTKKGYETRTKCVAVLWLRKQN